MGLLFQAAWRIFCRVLLAKADKDGQRSIAHGARSMNFSGVSSASGVPKDRLEILRKGYAATLKDPEFLAEAEKSKLYLD